MIFQVENINDIKNTNTEMEEGIIVNWFTLRLNLEDLPLVSRWFDIFYFWKPALTGILSFSYCIPYVVDSPRTFFFFFPPNTQLFENLERL